MLRTPVAVMTAAGLVLAGSLVAQKKDPLARSFARWMRDFKAGRIEPKDTRAKRKPYLDKTFLEGLSKPEGKYTRLHEAARLFELLKRNGTELDAKCCLQVVEVSLRKKGGKLWDVTGSFTQFREKLIEVLEKDGCPPAFQKVIVERVARGLADAPARGAGKKARTKVHKEPDIAVALIPVIASFNQVANRQLLEDLMQVHEGAIVCMAAEAFARMGYGPAVTAVARVLHDQEYPDDVAYLAGSLARLVPATQPKPAEKDLKYALNLVLDVIDNAKDWRTKVALVNVTRMIRARQSIPILINQLERAKAFDPKDAKRIKGSAPFSGVLLDAIEKALVDLTGFYAPAREPGRWRKWWQDVEAKFVLAPAREKIVTKKGDSVVAGFFGIPVSGNNVVFIVDVSGSMTLPIRTKDYVKGKTGRGAKGSFVSRIDRAKQELLRAVSKMPADSKFNVVFFSGFVRPWKKALVPSSDKNRKAFAKFLEKTHAGGGTMLYDGVDAALGLSKKPARGKKFATEIDEVFVLSDGAPTLGTITDPRMILKVVGRWNRRAQVRIHTIYLGDEVVDEDFAPPNRPQPDPDEVPPEEFMRRLAVENHGKFEVPAKSGREGG